VEQKVSKQAAEIKLGLRDKMELGNLDTFRDFGTSVDYVRAMWKILNHDTPDDFVIATGVATSIRDMCDVVFAYLGLDYKDYVIQNPKFMRPEELPYLRGDSTKAKTVLGWEPTYTFEQMMHEMVDHWMDELQGIKSLR
jgi:GDPmannose 4,6-dehydratase